jgi:hypothetical protein
MAAYYKLRQSSKASKLYSKLEVPSVSQQGEFMSNQQNDALINSLAVLTFLLIW